MRRRSGGKRKSAGKRQAKEGGGFREEEGEAEGSRIRIQPMPPISTSIYKILRILEEEEVVRCGSRIFGTSFSTIAVPRERLTLSLRGTGARPRVRYEEQ